MTAAAIVEFACEGCGAHVVALGRNRTPRSHSCSMCEWLSEFVPDPEEMMIVRARTIDFREDAGMRRDQRAQVMRHEWPTWPAP